MKKFTPPPSLIAWPLYLRALAIGFLGLSSIGAYADAPPFVPPTPTHKDVVYAKIGDVSVALDLYLQPPSAKPAPMVLWIHGGGWASQNKSDIELIFAKRFLDHGYNVASIDYRLVEVAIFPAQIYDRKAAVRWLRAHAAEYGYDGNKIVASGDSAGGHLSALLGTSMDDPTLEGDEGNPGVSSHISAVVDYCGPSDFFTWVKEPAPFPGHQGSVDMSGWLFGGPLDTKADLAKTGSPALRDLSKACPFFIVHGDKDSQVPISQSIELNENLKKAGIDSTLFTVTGADHMANSDEAFAATAAFLDRVLGKK